MNLSGGFSPFDELSPLLCLVSPPSCAGALPIAAAIDMEIITQRGTTLLIYWLQSLIILLFWMEKLDLFLMSL
jgi:hypothetical protein